MKKYTIKLDNKYISGIYRDLAHNINMPVFNNSGFHSYEKENTEQIVLSKVKGDALTIQGIRNLKSWIDKIYVRYESGCLDFKKIIIEEFPG